VQKLTIAGEVEVGEMAMEESAGQAEQLAGQAEMKAEV
jgi:hypothetical protein